MAKVPGYDNPELNLTPEGKLMYRLSDVYYGIRQRLADLAEGPDERLLAWESLPASQAALVQAMVEDLPPVEATILVALRQQQEREKDAPEYS